MKVNAADAPLAPANPSDVRYDGAGLAPAIVQDSTTGEVRMLGFMNAEALRRTIDTRRVWFWSRSRSRLWMKGESSGHTLELVGVFVDCDADTLLIRVHPRGPTCHTGAPSCFFRELATDG